MLIELTAAVGILIVVTAGFAAAMHADAKVLRACYYRAVAIELVDGEMERLAAGEWRAYGQGTHRLSPEAEAAANLPDGAFVLAVRGKTLRLEWTPQQRGKGGRVAREVPLP